MLASASSAAIAVPQATSANSHVLETRIDGCALASAGGLRGCPRQFAGPDRARRAAAYVIAQSP